MEGRKIRSYDIKVNRGDGFKYEGTEYLNVFDTDKQKDKEIKKIKAKYNITIGEYLNISNFNNVYY